MRNADNDECLLSGHENHDRGDTIRIRKKIGNKRMSIEIPDVYYCTLHEVMFKVIRKNGEPGSRDQMIILHIQDGIKIEDLHPTYNNNPVELYKPFTRA